jgi:hypothetical protein
MAHEIDIEIKPDGTVTFAVKGVKGKKCKEITKAIEEALGEVREVVKTSEYYEEEVIETTRVKAGE